MISISGYEIYRNLQKELIFIASIKLTKPLLKTCPITAKAIPSFCFAQSGAQNHKGIKRNVQTPDVYFSHNCFCNWVVWLTDMEEPFSER